MGPVGNNFKTGPFNSENLLNWIFLELIKSNNNSVLAACCSMGKNEQSFDQHKKRPDTLQYPALLIVKQRSLCECDVSRRFAAVTASFDVECYLLVVSQAC